MKGRVIPYSAEELAWLEANRLMVISDYHRAFNARFDRAVALNNLHALRKRKGWRTGRSGRFEAGQDPPNKGAECAPGRGGNHPNARKTQFKPGSRNGKARDRYKPIGFERVSSDGYLERKIHDGLPLQSRWRAVHLIRWEEIHGAIPDGHALKCLDGNRQNTDPANWQLISRGELAVLNSNGRWNGLNYETAPDELKPAILTIAKAKAAARSRRKTA